MKWPQNNCYLQGNETFLHKIIASLIESLFSTSLFEIQLELSGSANLMSEKNILPFRIYLF